MHFITKTINFIKADGRGSSYRLAEHNEHRFLVVFDEDMDMRVMHFVACFARDYAGLFEYVDFVGERKGSITVVFNPAIQMDAYDLNKLMEALANNSEYTGNDAWGGNAYVGFQLAKPESNNDDCMTSLFYPCNHRAATLAQMFAALKVARGLRRIDVPVETQWRIV